MLPSNKKTRLSVYVTHGSIMVLKCEANKFKENEYQVITEYTTLIRAYSIKTNDKLNVLLSAKGIVISTTAIDQTAFVAFINQIKTLDEVSTRTLRLCCDVNLGEIGGHDITPEYSYLVDQLAPTSIVPFTDTPECAISAAKKLGISIVDRKGLHAKLLTEIENEPPTPIFFEPHTPVGPFAMLSGKENVICPPNGTMSEKSIEITPPRNVSLRLWIHSKKIGGDTSTAKHTNAPLYKSKRIVSEELCQPVAPHPEEKSFSPMRLRKNWSFFGGCCYLSQTIASEIIPVTSAENGSTFLLSNRFSLKSSIQ